MSPDPHELGGPERVISVLAAMEQHMNNVPGFRRGHARGLAFHGTFTPTPEAAALSTAEILAGGPIEIVLRLSNGGSSPYLPDRVSAKRGNTVGMGVRFELPSGDHSTWTALSTAEFAARNADDFVALASAQRPELPGAQPNPLRIAAFLARHPHCFPGIKAAAALTPPESFATTAFHGLHAFYLVDADGRRRAFRYRWVPVAGERAMDPADDVALPPQYLVSEIKQRVEQAPVAWRLVFQLARPDDPVDDLTKQWPENREQVVAGELVAERLHEDQQRVEGWIFDPTRMPPGIELSDDPVLHFRSEAYAESHRRRLGERKPAIKPE
ncbi:MAG TPA: catalase family peroxidase [Solirubrobacteraceae bacterium]|nr:catalase family peroxidase [Solirubrobacteraceae bacterium]